MHHYLLSLALLLAMPLAAAAKDYRLASPDGRIGLTLRMNGGLSYALAVDDTTLIDFSPISLRLRADGHSVEPRRVGKARTSTHNGTIEAFAYAKSRVADNYRALTLTLNDGLSLEARAYNDGVAYRFVARRQAPFVVEAERAALRLAADADAYVPFANRTGTITQQFCNSFESFYRHGPVSTIDSGRLALTPLVIATPTARLVVTESGLDGYPGMFMRHTGAGPQLEGVWAPYPDRVEVGGGGQRQLLVKSHHDYLATAPAGSLSTPWRTVIVARQDKELLANDMVYRLAPANRIGATSWIRPGKAAWDWWNNFGLYGVPFKAGINTQTYKYYIDFAARYGLEYIILDEGWSEANKNDLMRVVPTVDLPELVAYGQQKGVGLILWAAWAAFSRNTDATCRHYAGMGIKGFKVDFMNRDDALMTADLCRAADTAARHHLVLDLHGMYQPAGMNRTYPNVLNFEGVMGLEQAKWSDLKDYDQVTYDCLLPYARQLSGSMDYTQGAMTNGQKGSYRASYNEPMSQGTRCRQLAQYVVFLSPLNMLSDSPSRYLDNDACTRFIAATPVTWDETIPLSGRLGEYVALARRKGTVWYVAAMTNWSPRTLQLDLTPLGVAGRKAHIFKDGPNAARIARDYAQATLTTPQNNLVEAVMAPGGGFVMRIE